MAHLQCEPSGGFAHGREEVPGHRAGQVALLSPPGCILFAADVCMNVISLGDPVGFENLNDGRESWPRKTGQGVKWIFCLTAA